MRIGSFFQWERMGKILWDNYGNMTRVEKEYYFYIIMFDRTLMELFKTNIG